MEVQEFRRQVEDRFGTVGSITNYPGSGIMYWGCQAGDWTVWADQIISNVTDLPRWTMTVQSRHKLEDIYILHKDSLEEVLDGIVDEILTLETDL